MSELKSLCPFVCLSVVTYTTNLSRKDTLAWIHSTEPFADMSKQKHVRKKRGVRLKEGKKKREVIYERHPWRILLVTLNHPR